MKYELKFKNISEIFGGEGGAGSQLFNQFLVHINRNRICFRIFYKDYCGTRIKTRRKTTVFRIKICFQTSCRVLDKTGATGISKRTGIGIHT